MSMIATREIGSPVGPLLVGVVDGGVCLLEFVGPRASRGLEELHRLLDADTGAGDLALLDRLEDELAAYFSGALRVFGVPLVMPGTAFQMKVWDELLRIGYGETISYGELARRVGSPDGQRAVGAANGRNRVAIVVPCHRVIDASGRLHGYGGGLERKRKLLELEGAIAHEPALFG